MRTARTYKVSPLIFASIALISACGPMGTNNRTSTGTLTNQMSQSDAPYYTPATSNVNPNPLPSGNIVVSSTNPPTLDPSAANGGTYNETLTQSIGWVAPFQADSSLKYQWYKNGAIISGATRQNFSINGIQPADYAYYTVEATNDLGNSSSGTFYLNPTIQMAQLGSNTCNGVQCGANEATAEQVCKQFYGPQSQIYYVGAWSPSYVKWTTKFCYWNGSYWGCDMNCASSCSGANVLGYVQCLQ